MRDTQEALQAPTIGVVLAGGRSQRMGSEKAALIVGGVPLLRRVVERLAVALPDILVIGPETLQALVPNIRVVPDEAPGRGPLGGIVTAFDAVPSQHLFVVACDMPFVEPALVHEMVRLLDETPDVDVVALRTQRGVEPLHALYRSTCLAAMRAQLLSGDGALHRLLEQLRVREVMPEDGVYYDPAGLSAFNANTPEEWQQAMDMMRDTLE